MRIDTGTSTRAAWILAMSRTLSGAAAEGISGRVAVRPSDRSR